MPSIKALLSLGITLGSTVYAHNLINQQHPHSHQTSEQIVELILSHGNSLCAQWNDDRCIRCAPRSYMGTNGICKQVDPYCQNFNEKTGKCSQCYNGYQLTGQKCMISNGSGQEMKDGLCAQWNRGICIKCAPKSYKNKKGICQQVDPNCNNYSEQSGSCQSCFKGYLLKQGKCAVQDVSQIYKSNPYCAQWNAVICLKCAPRTYQHPSTNICTRINQLCKTFNEKNGDCTSCYPGYKLLSGDCLIENSTNNKQVDPYCTQWSKGECTFCAPRSYLNAQKRCIQVDPYCNTFDPKNGVCLTCYKGYDLKNEKCMVSIVDPLQNSIKNNPLCSNWSGQVCTRCSNRSYFDQNKICKQIDPYCKQYSEQQRICVKCYIGYRLTEDKKKCVLPGATTVKQKDQTQCASWSSGLKERCVSCHPGSALTAQNKCRSYDNSCLKFNSSKWQCEQCKGDLIPIRQKCLYFEIDPNFDSAKCMYWKQGRCLQCSKCYSLNSAGSCVCPAKISK